VRARGRALAGRDWCDGFLLRWPQVSLRTAEPLHQARAAAEDEATFKTFFDKLRLQHDKHRFLRHNVYNMDETNKDPRFGKVLSCKGKKNVVVISDAKQEEHVTIVGCVSASGDTMPPMIIYKGKQLLPAWAKHNPEAMFRRPPTVGWRRTHHAHHRWATLPYAQLTCTNAGVRGLRAHPLPTRAASHSAMFVEWLKRFIVFLATRRGQRMDPDTGTIIDEPVLLLLDQHSSHLSAEALELAAANGIVVFGLVPHASHILQPLDVARFRPWHTNYGAALRAARNAEPTLVVTKDIFPKLMRKPRAASARTPEARCCRTSGTPRRS
jgi:hypothetical protein